MKASWVIAAVASCAVIALSARDAERSTPIPVRAGAAGSAQRFDVTARDFGVKGDGRTDDTDAMQAALDAAQRIGGTLLIPHSPSNNPYCIKGGARGRGLVVSSRISIVADQGIELQTCGAQLTTLTVDAAYSKIDGLVIAGPKLRDDGTPPDEDALRIGPRCVGCRVTDVRTQWGRHATSVAASDAVFDNMTSLEAYGSAVVYVGNLDGGASGYFKRNKTDTLWPVQAPPQGSTFAARAAGTRYRRGDVVTFAGFLLQAADAGTTAEGGLGRAPDFEATNVVDGTVSWRMAAPVGQCGVQFDTGTSVPYAEQGDYSGPYSAGICLTNRLIPPGRSTPLPSLAPQGVQIVTPDIGQTLTAGIDAGDGNALTVIGGNLGDCLAPGCAAGIRTHDHWLGEAVMLGSTLFQAPYGNVFMAGLKNKHDGGTAAGMRDAVDLVASSQFAVLDVDMSPSAAWGPNRCGVVIEARADHGLIAGNNFYGATGCDPSGIVRRDAGPNVTIGTNAH